MIWLTINEIAAFVTGLFFNLALLYLIQKRTPSLMRSYASILRIHCFSDLLFDAVNFLTTTQCITLKGRFFFINGGIHSAYWTPKMAFLSVETYLWIVVYVPLCLVPLDFFYRWRAVCHGDLISKRFITLWVALAYFFSFIVAFPVNGMYMVAGPSQETKQYDSILQTALGTDRLSGYLTMGLRGPLEMGVLILIVLVINVDYTFIGYVFWQLHKKIQESVSRNVSKKAEATQKQVTKIMLLQAFVPLVLCLPTSVNILAALFMIDIPGFAPFVFSMISWLAAFKPLATIIIVPHYRTTLFKLSSLSSSGITTNAGDLSNKSPSVLARRKSSTVPPIHPTLKPDQSIVAVCPNY
ncbi:hypothetical protein M3Y97_00182200 [Aphelenchoides bicaudatus]|nr:hypothetical protein M3Y97_00182200 [Aphelenchoides bicaudatus]